MKRRKLIILAAATSWMLACGGIARAQPAKIPRIGFLDPGARDSGFYTAFLQGMRELGYIEGKNIVIEARFADGKQERLPALAGELAELKLDIIIAQSTPGVRAAAQRNASSPIVMVAVGDPVGDKFAASLARPGGNITGLSILTSDIGPKLLEMLKAAVPKLSRIATLVNVGNPNSAVSLKNITVAAQKMSVTITPVEVRTADDIEIAFAFIGRQRSDGIVVPGDALFRLNAQQIASLALRHKLPSAVSNREIVEAGGLLSYGANIIDSYRRAATYVDKILKGAKPGELPIEQATRFEVTINQKTAAALGLTIPQELLLRADKVIE